MNLRLHHILFAAFTAIAAIPVLLLALWVQHWALTQQIDAVQEKHLMVAHNLTQALSRYVIDVRTVFNTAALQVLHGHDDPAPLLTAMHIRQLWLLQADGRPAPDTNGIDERYTRQFPAELFAALDKERANARNEPDKVVFSPLMRDSRGEPGLFLLRTLPEQRLAIGLLGTDYIRQMQGRIAFGDRGHAAIVDRTGRVMAHPLQAWQKEMEDISFLPPVQAMKRGETGVSTFYTPAMQADMIAGYTAVPEVGWGVMVPQPMAELEERTMAVRLIAIGIALVGMAIAALLAWRLSGHLARPISHVAVSARKVAQGVLSTRVHLSQGLLPREMHDLSDAFNHMVGEIDLKTRALRKTTRRLMEAQRIASIGNWEWDVGQGRFWHSHEVAYIFGHPRNGLPLTRHQLQSQVHPDDQKRLNQYTDQVLKDHQPLNIEYRILLPDGRLRHIYQESEVKLDRHGKPLRLMGTLRDITEDKEHAEQLQWQANHDDLTQLPNRRLFLRALNEALIQARDTQGRLALLFIDLDDLNSINNSLGYVAGDLLLRKVTERLSEALPEDYTLARGAGDEFTILVSTLTDAGRLVQLAEHLIALLNKAYMVEGYEMFIGCNVGIALFPDDAANAKDLLRNAHIATHAAKEAGRNTCRQFNLAMDQHMQRRILIRNELRTALERGDFVLNYQPIVAAASGEIYGAEALIRWNHAELGMISPAEFIPLAEDTGVIGPLGEYVLQQACSQAAIWNRQRHRPVRISVNLSTRQLQLGLTPSRVATILDQSGLSPDQLSLEITESLILDDTKATLDWLDAIRALGIHFSMDDFGTGYSSLSYLTRIPVDTLKLDRAFITDIERKPNSLVLLKAIIAMANNLQLRLIAEGVETRAQLDFLHSQHCDLIQGFYFSQPVTADVLTGLLKIGFKDKSAAA